jgi:hypothetical protein
LRLVLLRLSLGLLLLGLLLGLQLQVRVIHPFVFEFVTGNQPSAGLYFVFE